MLTSRQSAVRGLALGAATATLGLAACGGGDDDFANKKRPPTPINLTAFISEDRVSVSPRRFGGGPIILIVTNQTGDSQRVTLETDEPGGTQPGIRQSTGPINPRDTASIKVTLRQGEYVVKVERGAISPARLAVGPQRPSAQNKLLQP